MRENEATPTSHSSRDRIVILHAGTHKTGTTSIQALLRDQWQSIRELGFQVILDWPPGKKEKLNTNCSTIAHSFIRDELMTLARIDSKRAIGFGNRHALTFLRRQIEEAPCTRFILSAEAFCFMRTAAERELLLSTFRKLNCTLEPLLYFRNGNDWRASWSAQIERRQGAVKFRADHPRQFTLLDDWYFDHAALVRFWRDVNAATVLIDYDKVVAQHGSVIPSFLQFCGLPQTLARRDYFENRRADNA